jgi:CheY-like chemotaxis protein
MRSAGKVLVVDDYEANLVGLGKLLQAAHYTVVTATNGRDALNAVKDHRPDLVLLDVVMPGVDGWQMLQRVQERHGVGTIPVIMFSGKVDESAAAEAASRGAQGFIGKPFNPQELIDQTKQLLPA